MMAPLLFLGLLQKDQKGVGTGLRTPVSDLLRRKCPFGPTLSPKFREKGREERGFTRARRRRAFPPACIRRPIAGQQRRRVAKHPHPTRWSCPGRAWWI